MNFQKYAHYYNLLYLDKDYQEEADTVLSLLRKFAGWDCEKGKRLLNIGCGTGKHDFAFAQRGCILHGIDLSTDMIKEAEKRAQEINSKATFETADARSYQTNKTYDAVVSLFHVASYQNTNEDLIKYIQTAAGALQSGGIFIFDAWYGPGVLTDRPTYRMKTVEDEQCKVIRFATPTIHGEKNVVDVQYRLIVQDKLTGIAEEIEELHLMRYFFVPEMKYYLEQQGFNFLSVLDCKTLTAPTFESWTTFFIAQKGQK